MTLVQKIRSVVSQRLRGRHSRVAQQLANVLHQHGVGDTTPCFSFQGRKLKYFPHHFNCGWPPAFSTERTVELAIADSWLGPLVFQNTIEVGAVSPYYWPGRIPHVIDPADPHPQVTDRRSVMDVDLSASSLLCLSTLEHVGLADYGMAAQAGLATAAVSKVIAECPRFLVTVPAGYNPELDAWLFPLKDAPQDVITGYLARCGPYWEEVDATEAVRRGYGERAANAICVLWRGEWGCDGDVSPSPQLSAGAST